MARSRAREERCRQLGLQAHGRATSSWRSTDTIYFGHGAYGVRSAAQIYFQVEPRNLTLGQAAFLVGLTQAPSLLDPLTNLPGAKERQRQVLDAMVRERMINREEADRVSRQAISVSMSSTASIASPGFADRVREQLAGKYGRDLEVRGLRVVSTLDWQLQQTAQRILDGALAAGRGTRAGALVALDPRSGAILALAESDAGALRPARSSGTSFRAFTYAAAIASKRYTMVTPLIDAPTAFEVGGPTPYQPANADRRFHGMCELRVCMGSGLNVPAVRVQSVIGTTAVVELARNLGAAPYKDGGAPSGDPPESFGLALTLGGYGQTPLQMATAAATLANLGLHHEPQAITTVSASGGPALPPDRQPARQVLDAEVAFVVSQMLADEANRALASGPGPSLPGRRAAVWTGASDGWFDDWAIGYTPSLAVAVWIGASRPGPGRARESSEGMAAPVWQQFLREALNQLQRADEWYEKPGSVQVREVGGRPAYFLPGTSPSTPPPPLPDWVRPR